MVNHGSVRVMLWASGKGKLQKIQNKSLYMKHWWIIEDLQPCIQCISFDMIWKPSPIVCCLSVFSKHICLETMTGSLGRKSSGTSTGFGRNSKKKTLKDYLLRKGWYGFAFLQWTKVPFERATTRPMNIVSLIFGPQGQFGLTSRTLTLV